jgi:hypothetical protein
VVITAKACLRTCISLSIRGHCTSYAVSKMQQESPLSESTSTPQGAHSDAASSRITRKSHRKSRAGCKNCKTRRIKVHIKFLFNQVVTSLEEKDLLGSRYCNCRLNNGTTAARYFRKTTGQVTCHAVAQDNYGHSISVSKRILICK